MIDKTVRRAICLTLLMGAYPFVSHGANVENDTIQAPGGAQTKGSVTMAEHTRPIYQEQLDRALDAYPGQISGRSDTDHDVLEVKPTSIRVLRDEKSIYDGDVMNGLPTRIDANHMKYYDTTGYVTADGNVVIRRGNQTVTTELVTGNTKTGAYEIKSGYTLRETGQAPKEVEGQALAYQMETGNMTSQSAHGYVEPYYFKAHQIRYTDGVGYIQDGWITSKHAMAFTHTPDYHIRGEYIEVHPNDKMIIQRPSFWIKNTKILSLPKYTISLRNDKKGTINVFSLIPVPAYNSNGFSLHGRLTYPLGTRGETYIDYTWSTRNGLVPAIGYRHYMPWGMASVSYSKEENTFWDHSVWVTKRPELAIDTHTYHIGRTPMTVRGSASIGYWSEGDVKGSHHKEHIELSHDAITWAHGKYSCRFYGGYQHDAYGATRTVRRMPYWGVKQTSHITDKWQVWAAYEHRYVTKNEISPYPFDRIEIPQNIVVGTSYQLTRLDRMSLNTQTDAQTGKMVYRDWTWERDLHSLKAFVTYREKQKKWKCTIRLKDF